MGAIPSQGLGSRTDWRSSELPEAQGMESVASTHMI